MDSLCVQSGTSLQPPQNFVRKSAKHKQQHPAEHSYSKIWRFQHCHTMQDALLDEEGAIPADGFSGDANAVSLRLPQAKAETKQRMQTAEEAHEVSTSPAVLLLYVHVQHCAC